MFWQCINISPEKNLHLQLDSITPRQGTRKAVNILLVLVLIVAVDVCEHVKHAPKH